MKVYSSLVAIGTVLLTPALALAQEASTGSASSGYIAIAAAIAICVAALGGTLGQGRAVSAALDAIGRNPAASGKVFLPMILGLALIESLVILSFVIAIQLVGKV